MSQATESTAWDPMFLPVFLGSAASVPAGALLEHWFPKPMANGVGFFLGWMVAGLMFSFWPPIPKWRLWRWSVCGAFGALVGATITYLLQE